MRKCLPLISLLLLAALAAGILVSGSDSGSSSDPLATLSYLQGVFLPRITAEADKKVASATDKLRTEALKELDALYTEKSTDAAAGVLEQAVLERLGAGSGTASLPGVFKELTLQQGDSVSGGLGISFFLRQGSAGLSGDFVNVTAGAAASSGQQAAAGNSYLSASESCRVTALKDRTVVCVQGAHSVTRAYTPVYESAAEAMRTLGLFLGTNSGFELDRAATRIEALVMLIRLLGEEQTALACTDKNPFTDVDVWADRYAAYAYARGYTKGRSATRFDSTGEVSFDEYATFLLRALGYSEEAGDFVWSSASSAAVSAGLLSESERSAVASARFRRDQVVFLSARALSAPLKGNTARLSDRLIANGSVSALLFEQEKHRLPGA